MPSNGGGYAFPQGLDHQAAYVGCEGMSLLDYFAGHALTGILSAEAHPQAKGAIPADKDLALFVALNAYTYADAMIKAREGFHAPAGAVDEREIA